MFVLVEQHQGMQKCCMKKLKADTPGLRKASQNLLCLAEKPEEEPVCRSESVQILDLVQHTFPAPSGF